MGDESYCAVHGGRGGDVPPGAKVDDATARGRGYLPEGDAEAARRYANPTPTYTPDQRDAIVAEGVKQATKAAFANQVRPGQDSVLPPPVTTAFPGGAEASTSRAADIVARIRREHAGRVPAAPPYQSGAGSAPGSGALDPGNLPRSGVAELQDRVTTFRQQLAGGGPGDPGNRVIQGNMLAFCELCADGALGLEGEDGALASQLLAQGSQILDLATDFMPGVSLVKDLVSITTRINPITNEKVGDVEAGLLAAGILFPGALEGAAKGVGKAAKAIAAAIKRNGKAMAAAERLAEPIRKAERFIKALREGATETAHYSPEATRRLAQAADHAGDIVDKTARELRNSPGKAVVTRPLFDSEKILNGTHANAGLVPKEVAERMAGKEFKNFDQFRAAFWEDGGRVKVWQAVRRRAREAGQGVGACPKAQRIGQSGQI